MVQTFYMFALALIQITPRERYFASFRPSGLIEDVEIESAGLFVKEGDVLELGLSERVKIP